MEDNEWNKNTKQKIILLSVWDEWSIISLNIISIIYIYDTKYFV